MGERRSRKNRKHRFEKLVGQLGFSQFAGILLSFRPYDVLESFAAAHDPEATLFD
jgi:hypothetical protein